MSNHHSLPEPHKCAGLSDRMLFKTVDDPFCGPLKEFWLPDATLAGVECECEFAPEDELNPADFSRIPRDSTSGANDVSGAAGTIAKWIFCTYCQLLEHQLKIYHKYLAAIKAPCDPAAQAEGRVSTKPPLAVAPPPSPESPGSESPVPAASASQLAECPPCSPSVAAGRYVRACRLLTEQILRPHLPHIPCFYWGTFDPILPIFEMVHDVKVDSCHKVASFRLCGVVEVRQISYSAGGQKLRSVGGAEPREIDWSSSSSSSSSSSLGAIGVG